MIRLNNIRKKCYHLAIKSDNLLAIYNRDIENLFKIEKINLKEFNSQEIKELIKEFEDSYTNYDYLSYVANTSTSLNKTAVSSNDGGSMKKKSNSLSSLNSKQTPYSVPSSKLQTTNGQSQLKVQAVNKPTPLSNKVTPLLPPPLPPPAKLVVSTPKPKAFHFKSTSNLIDNSSSQIDLTNSSQQFSTQRTTLTQGKYKKKKQAFFFLLLNI